MKNRLLAFLFSLATLLTTIAGPVRGAAIPTTPAVVEAGVADEVAAGGTIWIILRERADLAAAPSIADWTARGQYVVDTLTAASERSQAGLRRSLVARGASFESFWIINAIAVHRPDKGIVALAAGDPAVERVTADPSFSLVAPVKGTEELSAGTAEASSGIAAVEWGLTNIGAPAVWSTYGIDGGGITVATIDTGVTYTHAALVGHYRGTNGDGTFTNDYNWYDPYGDCVSAPCDTNGHGSHTMGTIAGGDAANTIGVAPGARWIAARGCNTSSCGSTQLTAAAQWILAPRATGSTTGGDASKRPQLVSNSWGGTNGADTWYQSYVDAWVASGIFPVFANGNNGTAGCGSVGAPGSYANSYGVGAYDSANAIAYFSSRGPSPLATVGIKPDISAPGVNVRSAWYDGTYNTISGTSMATPHVAGAVALVLAAAPSLIGQIGAVRDLLDSTATPVSDLSCGGSASDNNVWGRGRLNVLAAVGAAPRAGTGRLTGIVRNAGTSAAVSGATVTLTPGSRTAITGADGRYTFALAAGTYAVGASAFGYSDGSVANLSVSTDATTNADIALTALPLGNLAGVVRDPSGAVLPGATVSLPGTTIGAVTTNSSGAYTFTGLPVATYAISVVPTTQPCAAASSANATLTAGTTTQRNFALTAFRTGAGYSCSATLGLPIAAGDTATALTGDDAYMSIALPFAFAYHGTSYSSATLSTNGWLSFTAQTSAYYGNAQLPSTGGPNNLLAPFWADLIIDPAPSGVFTGASGVAPNRTFTVEWRSARLYGSASTTSDRVTVSLTLGEDGTVSYGYGSLPATSFGQGGYASIGIENATGSDGHGYLYRSAILRQGQTIRYTQGLLDTTPPVATIAAPASPTNASSPTYTVSFSEAVGGLTASDFSLTSTAPGCAIGAPAGSGAAFTVAVSGCGEGTMTLALNAYAVTDLAGNAGPATAVLAPAVTIDRTAPSASITAPASPTAAATLTYAIDFSEPVLALASGDLALTGAGCTIDSVTWPSTTTAAVAVGGCADGATVDLVLLAGSITDVAGNAGPANPVAAATVAIDRSALAAPAIAFTAASTSSLTLSWSVVTGSPVSYRVYAGTSLIATTAGTSVAIAKPNKRTGYTVRAVDAAGTVGPASSALFWPDADKVAPGSVTLAKTGSTTKSISLAWSVATDNLGGISAYRVYSNTGKLVATVSGTTLSWSGSKGTATSWTVRAVDIAGNEGANSNSVL